MPPQRDSRPPNPRPEQQPTAARRSLLNDLSSARLRRGPAFHLLRLAELSSQHRRQLGDLADGPADSAVLLPSEESCANHSAKIIDQQTADLLTALDNPRHLADLACTPRSAEPEASEVESAVARLILDGVVEIESAGAFLAGPRAHPALFAPSRPAGSGGGGRLAQLSLAALRYAERLPIDDARALSYRLYGYNRVPLHAAWEDRFGSPAAIETALGLDQRTTLSTLLAQKYDEEEIGGWRSWNRDGQGAATLTHKLYVSPHPESLATALRAAITTFVDTGVTAFKIGRDLSGLLRPDKIVAYFPSRAALERTASALAPHLDGLRAQGVPFSAEMSCGAMLSWGSDPPVDQKLVPWRGLESWRLWITNQLASALLLARAQEDCPVEPWRFALDRLALDGVDIDTWSPAPLQADREAA